MNVGCILETYLEIRETFLLNALFVCFHSQTFTFLTKLILFYSGNFPLLGNCQHDC